MDDEDTILFIYSSDEEFKTLFEENHQVNKVEPERPEPAPGSEESEASHGGGEPVGSTTRQWDPASGEEEQGYRLTFSNGPKTKFGFVFGKGTRCDFGFPGIEGLSENHFALQFDAEDRLIVKDLTSSVGTSVIYDGDDRGQRRDIHWIIGGCSFLQHIRDNIFVRATQDFEFRVAVPEHDLKSPRYREKVERFRQGRTGTEDLLGELEIQTRPPTQRGSKAQTPSRLRGPCVYQRDVGCGGFGRVSRHWNSQTGEEWAVKVPLDQNCKQAEWVKEAEFMKKLSHDHIVRFINAEFKPIPTLAFEYCDGGSLRDQLRRSEPFSRFETVQVLRQATDVLKYLHGQNIMHRDISTGNILVHSRDAHDIFIKFADFGLAKQGGDLQTMCGHPHYHAPEIELGGERGIYSSSVGIWSLGVVVAELLCGLPDSTTNPWHETICERVRAHHTKTKDTLTPFLLGSMLVIDPSGRSSAAYCHSQALNLPDGSKSRSKSRSGIGVVAETDESTIRAPRRENPGSSEPSLDEASLDRMIVGFPKKRDGPATRRAKVRRALDEMRNPNDPAFVGSTVEEIGPPVYRTGGRNTPFATSETTVRGGSSHTSRPLPSPPSSPTSPPEVAPRNSEGQYSLPQAERNLHRRFTRETTPGRGLTTAEVSRAMDEFEDEGDRSRGKRVKYEESN